MATADVSVTTVSAKRFRKPAFTFREMRHGDVLEFEARELFDKDAALEKEYAKYYHAVVRESTLEEVFSKVLETIEKLAQDPVWIPVCE